LPERYESGTLNIAALAGFKAGIDFITSKGVETIQEHELFLITRLVEGLAAINGVTVINMNLAKPRGPVLSFTVKSIDPSLIGFTLDKDFDIAVRVGLHCAPLAHRTIGTFPEGTVRVSPGVFNSSDDIDCFLAAMNAIASGKVRETTL